MEPRVPIWHSGTREAFLIHVGFAQEAIKKKGSFKSTRNLPNLIPVALRISSYASYPKWMELLVKPELLVKLELLEYPTKFQ